MGFNQNLHLCIVSPTAHPASSSSTSKRRENAMGHRINSLLLHNNSKLANNNKSRSNNRIPVSNEAEDGDLNILFPKFSHLHIHIQHAAKAGASASYFCFVRNSNYNETTSNGMNMFFVCSRFLLCSTVD